jgi:hypothetical protein
VIIEIGIEKQMAKFFDECPNALMEQGFARRLHFNVDEGISSDFVNFGRNKLGK